VGHDAFAVIRETIRSMDMVAIGRVALTSRELIIARAAVQRAHDGDSADALILPTIREALALRDSDQLLVLLG
jgi:non-homologous end joining protein Ku